MCAHTLLYIVLEGAKGRQMEIKEDRGQLKMKGRMDLNNTSLLFRLLVESVCKCEHDVAGHATIPRLRSALSIHVITGG